MLTRLARWSDSHELTRRGRQWLATAPGVSRAISALDRRRLHQLEEEGRPGERAKQRWRDARPEPGLTWGREVSGDPAVEAAERHGVFGPDATVVEIGPGYGRILGAALRRGVAFRRYVAVDLSEENVRHLRAEFDDPRVEIVQGDAETVEIGEPIDVAISFLTFKHIYPSFAIALANLGRQLRPGGTIAFDLIEGTREYFHRDKHTFMREYTREEAAEIVAGASLELVEIDRVEHAPGRTRMLIVATRR
jgi:SAM-dependent methyltransferase